MQTRHYDSKNGLKCWLSENEQEALLRQYRNDTRRELALSLGLAGLRTDEVIEVRLEDFRRAESPAADSAVWKLLVRDGKTGRRETPVSKDVYDLAERLANSAGLRRDDDLIDREKRTVRTWVEQALDEIADSLEADGRGRDAEEWRHVGMHDLRRTWATDTFYSLALSGVPIAEELTMGWGGWKMNEKGRETFREEYLGPEPDHVAIEAADHLGLGVEETGALL